MDDHVARTGNGHGGALLRTLTSPFNNMFRGSFLHGLTFGWRRDTYEALGYERILTPLPFRGRYRRGGIAARIVEAFPLSTWRGGWTVTEDDNPDVETAFEQAFEEFDRRLSVKNVILRADILAGLGRYAVILIGGPGSLDEPLVRCNLQDIKYLVPYGEDTAKIIEYETDATDERYALPKMYALHRQWYQQQYGQAPLPVGPTTPVHWTRVIHVAEGLLDDNVFGQPRLERVWNLLDDLDKVIGGGAEAFWKRADGGTQFKIDPDLALDPDPTKAALQRKEMETKFDEFTNQLRRNLVTRGIEIQRLGSDVANLKGPAEAIMDQISATIGIPQRLLMGSELGRLASSKDKANWEDRVQDRRTSFGEYQVVRPFIDRLISFGVLPQPKEYKTEWPETEELDEQEKVSVAVQVSTINRNEGEIVVTPSEIRTIYLGLEAMTPAQQKEVLDAKADKVKLQQQIFAGKNPAPFGGKNGQGQESEPVAPIVEPKTAMDLKALEQALIRDDAEAVEQLLLRVLEA